MYEATKKYYNKNKGKIIKVKYVCTPTKTIKKDYVLLSDYKYLTLLERRNIKLIAQMKDNKLYHVSPRKINNIRSIPTDVGSLHEYSSYINPTGFWISCGPAWQDYTKNNFGNIGTLHKAQYVYEITINPEVILEIKTVSELYKFINKYKFADDIITPYKIINWSAVKKAYSGLIICPYLGDEIWGTGANEFYIQSDRSLTNYYEKLDKLLKVSWKKELFFLAEWYRHWEVASGVVWRKNGITEFKLVTKMDII